MAANHPSRIKQYVRHPQLTGVALWAGAHLLLNGDSRSVILFAGMGVWALTEIVLISRREGLWRKPESPSWLIEMRGLLIAVVVFAVFIALHPFITGMPVI